MADIVVPESVAVVEEERKPLTLRGQLLLSNFWFALNFLWSPIGVVIIPDQVRAIDPVHKFGSLAIVLSLGALMATITQPLVGAFSDRTLSRLGPRRPYIILGTLLTCGSLFWMAWSNSIIMLMFAFLFMQLTSNIAGAAYQALIPDLVPEHQRGTASGWMGLMTQVGTIGGIFICGSLIQDFHWRYYVIAGVILVFMIPTILSVPVRHVNPDHIEPFSWGAFLRSFWISPRKYPDFFWVFFTRALVTLGFYTMLSFLDYYLLDVTNHGHASQQVVDNDVLYLTIALIVSAVFTSILGGIISDRLKSRKIPVYVSTAIQGTGMCVFLLHPSFSVLLIVTIFFGIGYGAYNSVDWALATQVLPSTRTYAKDMGVWSIAGVLPQVLAPIIHGPIVQVFNAPEHPVLGFDIIFAMAVVYYFLGAVFVKNIRGVK